MAKGGTRALEALRRAGVDHEVHAYEAAAGEASYGEAVAAALGVAPERLFKTLVASVDDVPCVAIVPVAGRLSLKKLAAARGGKRAALAEPADAERLTGYVVGGISPFGQRRRLPALVDRTIELHETVLVSGGRRGIQIELAPADLIATIGAIAADLAA